MSRNTTNNSQVKPATHLVCRRPSTRCGRSYSELPNGSAITAEIDRVGCPDCLRLIEKAIERHEQDRERTENDHDED